MKSMRRLILSALAALALAGSTPAWANCSAYTTGGCNNYGNSQSGQTYNGFNGGEQHRCVTTCDSSGRRCETHCY
jgi:hypothetical protein